MQWLRHCFFLTGVGAIGWSPDWTVGLATGIGVTTRLAVRVRAAAQPIGRVRANMEPVTGVGGTTGYIIAVGAAAGLITGVRVTTGLPMGWSRCRFNCRDQNDHRACCNAWGSPKIHSSDWRNCRTHEGWSDSRILSLCLDQPHDLLQEVELIQVQSEQLEGTLQCY